MTQDRYEIRGKIGQGGVGSVYRAFDTQLNREVAIKRVLAEGGFEEQEEATKSMLKEATALSSVQHPHIVTIYDAGVDDDGPYVIMELIDGRTLDEMVEVNVLTWEDLREIIIQSQEALIAAQDLDLVHRDLKPSNLMICWLPSGKFQVKIVDFGLAKFSSAPSLQTIDHGDSVFGSIFFMAPEQFERTPLDKRTDMYALGCLYYYALTGQHPFNGETPAQVMVSHLQHHVTPVIELRPDIPQWGADWIMWHVERQMDQRPADAREALERFLALEKNPAAAVPIATASQVTPAAPTLLTPATSATPVNPAAPATPQAPASPLATVTPVTPASPKTPASTPTPGESGQTNQPTLLKPAAPAQPSAKATAAQPLVAATVPLKANTATTAATVPVAKPTPTQPGSAGDGDQQLDASGLGTESAKKTMPTGAKWALICMLAFVIVVAAVVGSAIMDERKQTKLINDVMVRAKALDDEQKLGVDGIDLTEEELKGTLARATSMGENKQQPILLMTLRHAKAAGGYDIEAIILNHTIGVECPPSIRAGLLQDVIKWRGNPDAIPKLIEFANKSTKEEESAAAIDAVRGSVSGQKASGYVKNILSLIKATESSKVRMAAERALQVIIDESSNKSEIGATLYDQFKSAENDAVKFTMLRLLGNTGEDFALDAIGDALNSGEATYQTAALTALAKWKNDDQFPVLVAFIKDPKNKNLRKEGFKAANAFLGIERERDSSQLKALWTSLADIVESIPEKRLIISGMAHQKHEWAIEILKPYTEDEDDKTADRAEQAIERIKKNLSKKEAEDPEE